MKNHNENCESFSDKTEIKFSNEINFINNVKVALNSGDILEQLAMDLCV